MKKQKPDSENKQVRGIKNLDIEIDSFGALQMNNSIDAINQFLDRNITDKKLAKKDRANKKRRKK